MFTNTIAASAAFAGVAMAAVSVSVHASAPASTLASDNPFSFSFGAPSSSSSYYYSGSSSSYYPSSSWSGSYSASKTMSAYAQSSSAYAMPQCWSSCFAKYQVDSEGCLCTDSLGSVVDKCIASGCDTEDTAGKNLSFDVAFQHLLTDIVQTTSTGSHRTAVPSHLRRTPTPGPTQLPPHPATHTLAATVATTAATTQLATLRLSHPVRRGLRTPLHPPTRLLSTARPALHTPP